MQKKLCDLSIWRTLHHYSFYNISYIYLIPNMPLVAAAMYVVKVFVSSPKMMPLPAFFLLLPCSIFSSTTNDSTVLVGRVCSIHLDSFHLLKELFFRSLRHPSRSPYQEAASLTDRRQSRICIFTSSRQALNHPILLSLLASLDSQFYRGYNSTSASIDQWSLIIVYASLVYSFRPYLHVSSASLDCNNVDTVCTYLFVIPHITVCWKQVQSYSFLFYHLLTSWQAYSFKSFLPYFVPFPFFIRSQALTCPYHYSNNSP